MIQTNIDNDYYNENEMDILYETLHQLAHGHVIDKESVRIILLGLIVDQFIHKESVETLAIEWLIDPDIPFFISKN